MMEEIQFSDWPDPPGSNAWLPAYGYQQREMTENEDIFATTVDSGNCTALYLETIVEETSEELRSVTSSSTRGDTWLSDDDDDADADSVIYVTKEELESGSEREFLCPAKRRRPNETEAPLTDTSDTDSLSRSSSLARFESLERTCAAGDQTRRRAPSAESLSEDSGYCERRPRLPARAAASAPCLTRALRHSPPRARARARSAPDRLDEHTNTSRQAAPANAPAAAFQQRFRVRESLTVSVADLTALDYRAPAPAQRRRPPHPPPPPPPSLHTHNDTREPSSSGSDSTAESEREFTLQMEATARSLDPSTRNALARALPGAAARDLALLTSKRLEPAWGAWDDVLDELRRRRLNEETTTSRTPTPPPALPSHPSPPPRRREDPRARSTPELRARAPTHSETPDDLRASMRHVAPPPPPPPARSVSSGSKGVTFCPVVAEVSWREVSYSDETPSESTADDEESESEDSGECAVPGGDACGLQSECIARASTERLAAMSEAGARAPRGRSRIAGFLSRFANFRFPSRKTDASGKKPPLVPVRRVESEGARTGAVRIPLRDPSPPTTPEVTRTRRPAEAPPEAPVSAALARKPPRAPRAGVLETDVDTARTVVHARALSLLTLPAPPRDARHHYSMEYLLDKENARVVQPPENDLQKNSDRVLSEHELRVQRSLQKLNVPEWYKNAPAPREGFLLRKRLSDASAAPPGRWTGLSSKTTSLGSLGGAPAPTPPSNTQLSPANTSFGRWSTSRLNSNQTSPCSSTRSSVRGGSACGASPLRSPSTRSSFSARQPYLGWRSQERLATTTPRTPHERLANSLLPQTPPSKASEEIRSSIKEVTSAIVHYVSGLEPHSGGAPETISGTSPRGSQKLYWRESSFVGTKPLESPQTPIVVTQSGLPPPHPKPPTTLKLESRAAPSTTEWQSSQHSLLSLGITRPSPGSTTLEDVLDSLLGLPAAPVRAPSPQPTPRKTYSPYYLLTHKTSKYDPYKDQTNSLPAINSEKPLSDYEDHQQNSLSNYSNGDVITDNGDVITDNGDIMKAQRRSSADSASSISILAPGRTDTLIELKVDSHERLLAKLSSENHRLQRQKPSHNPCGRERMSTQWSGYDSVCRQKNKHDATDTVDATSMSTSTHRTTISKRRLRSSTRSDSSRQHSAPGSVHKTHSLDRATSADERRNSDATNSDVSQSKLSDLRESKTSLKSITSLNTDNSCEEFMVKCKYSKCSARATSSEAKRHYKNCHNCNYSYCSKECRRAHWERHRKVCLHSRASSLCRQILSTAKEDGDSLHHVSSIAYKGYLAAGRGVVKVIFTSPELAEKFTTHGFQHLGEPVYVRWPDIEPNEMGPELYSELVKLCKSYNPETRVILYVAVCIISEVPTEGAVKWERQLVSRCAKLRLSKTISLQIAQRNLTVTHSSPRSVRRSSRDEMRRSHRRDSIETLILTSKSIYNNDRNTATSHKSRQICFSNIQKQLKQRGVSLKKHFPEVYTKLISYVDGTSDKFLPVTIYPKDSTSGCSFICVIMPELYDQDPHTLPDGSKTVHTVDISIDTSLDQVSTPM